jgi:branched-chain amino acid aminotransferase
MQERINVNGRITPPEQAAVSPLDRGFLFGDSVYETIRTYGETPFRLGAHLDRLRRSSDRVGIPYERTPVRIENEVFCTVRAAGRGDAAIRIILSRGVGPVNYETADVGAPTCVIHVRPFPHPPPHHLSEGIDVAVVGVIRNSVHALDPAIKSSNLLNNFMAWTEARKLRAEEPILLNSAGQVTEGASSNVFLVKDRRLLTPPLEAGILQGITRDLVLDLARRAAIDTAEKALRTEDLRDADELFITSTLKGILPVKRCDGWPIREGRPGPMTTRLMAMYEENAQAETNAGSAPGDSLK